MINAGINAMKQSTQMIEELTKAFTDGLDSDEKIEEARLELLANQKDPNVKSNPVLNSMFESEEMQELLKDPKKWKESVQLGLGKMNPSQGAGVGEL